MLMRLLLLLGGQQRLMLLVLVYRHETPIRPRHICNHLPRYLGRFFCDSAGVVRGAVGMVSAMRVATCGDEEGEME